MLGRTDSRRRLLFLLLVFAVGTCALVARLAYWQVIDQSRLAAEALAQTTVTLDTPSKRGDIYDRTGTIVLATTVQRERLVAAPDQLDADQRRTTVATLAPILGLDDAAAVALRDKLTGTAKYVILRHGIERQMGDQIRAAIAAKTAFAISLEPEPERVYPQVGGGPGSSLAAHLLGFVNREGGGQYGVEQQYQSTLAGQPRIVVADRDASGQPILDDATVTQVGQPGTDLTLTIDAGLQLRVEQELLAAWIADKAKSVSAVVMDPHTGEIYAMATYPSYDGNDYKAIAASDPSRFIDPIVASVYEPGSVFKMMTAAAALTNGTVTPLTRVKDTGTLHLDGGRTKIDDADRKPMGWMTFQDGVAYSRNVVAAKVALGLGKTTQQSSAILHDMWLRLGYGKPTGIDVAGEVGGLVRDPAIKPWRQIDLANGAFGQGVAVTPIQLATAYAALADGGTMVQPHVVKEIGDRAVPVEPKATGVVDPSVSRTLVGMMEHVITEVPFYRDRTLVPGYDVGGKTGTAQIWDPKANNGHGAWKANLFNYSFVGYIARTPGVPDLVVAIQIEEGTPTVLRVGHIEMPVMSFELFRRIATDGITTPDLLPPKPAPLTPHPDR
ncbi:MAG TPA: penicillin-binding protein 2 [Candidatus Limnocylindrales bacterium]|nr:penicillin-binding protein 2 [Candidatus Limnocylindrales bacterium]